RADHMAAEIVAAGVAAAVAVPTGQRVERARFQLAPQHVACHPCSLPDVLTRGSRRHTAFAYISWEGDARATAVGGGGRRRRTAVAAVPRRSPGRSRGRPPRRRPPRRAWWPMGRRGGRRSSWWPRRRAG